MIASAADYATVARQLLPPGRAWSRDPDSVLGRLLAGLAEEPARIEGRLWQLLDEADPRTAIELLVDWERLVGLDGAGGSIAERQRAVAAKIAFRGGQSIAYFVAIAAGLGFAVTIDEFTPSYVGGMRAGDRLASVDWCFAWRVRVLGGVGGAMPSAFVAAALERTIRDAAPAHTLVHFTYPEAP